MNESKQIQAERLFQAIGEVDEQLLVSIIQNQPHSGQKRTLAARLRPLTRIAVAAVLSITVLVGGIRMLGLMNDGAGESTAIGVSMEEVLLQNISVMDTVGDASEIDFFTSVPTLICRFDENGDYFLYPLSGDFTALYGGEGSKPLTAAQSAQQPLRIWVCDGNGNVFSPQLLAASGNLSYGCLFEYLPEIAPGDEALLYLEHQFV